MFKWEENWDVWGLGEIVNLGVSKWDPIERDIRQESVDN